MNYSPTFWVFCQQYVDISVNRNNETVLFKRRYKKCFLSRFTDKHVTNVQVIIRCSFLTGRYEHTSSLLQPAVMRWTGGAWPAVSGARPPPPPAPRPPVSFITAAYEKRYSEVISVKLGTSQVFCHPWRLHTCEAAGGGSDALQHLSAGRGLLLHLQRPDNSYCSSRPTYSKQGGGPVINKSSLSALNASLEAGYIKDPTYTDMSAPSEDGRKTRSSGHMTDT